MQGEVREGKGRENGKEEMRTEISIDYYSCVPTSEIQIQIQQN